MSSDNWTAAQIPDQTGRVAVVTGANSGLGFAAAYELARAGAEVVLACRDTGRGDRAAERIRSIPGAGRAEVLRLDLADLSSVREFAAQVTERHPQLDLLLNNAGVMAVPRQRTVDGFELQFATNHLGHFALTGLLLAALGRRPDARVVTVSSNAHKMGRINFDDLQGERRYHKWPAYSQSKLANLLFALELQRRAEAAGWTLRSVATHPGYTATNLQLTSALQSGSRLNYEMMHLGNRLIGQPAEMGALPPLYAATVPDLPGGSFVGPGGLLQLRGHPKLVSTSGRARDAALAARLWSVSEDLTGVRYDFTATRSG